MFCRSASNSRRDAGRGRQLKRICRTDEVRRSVCSDDAPKRELGDCELRRERPDTVVWSLEPFGAAAVNLSFDGSIAASKIPGASRAHHELVRGSEATEASLGYSPGRSIRAVIVVLLSCIGPDDLQRAGPAPR